MSTCPHILVIEDDPEIACLVRDYLAQNGFRCDVGDNGGALDRFITTNGEPDLIILDLMLPGEDGLAICGRLRATSQVPILMLTARAEEIDRIIGLEIGADDYLVKPFNPRELVARIKAILRRQAPTTPNCRCLSLSDLTIDLEARAVRRHGDHIVALTAAEFDLLECFVTRPGRVLSRDQLMDWTRGRKAESFDRAIDVTISRLRKKIETGGEPLIKTIRNQGYILSAHVRDAPNNR